MIWIALGLSLVVVAGLAWPVLRRADAGPSRAAYDLAVFQDQLKEVDRDLARGVLTESEADGARLEIHRRILAAGRAPAAAENRAASPRSRWIAAGAMAATVPAIALAVYLKVGTPDPLQAELAAVESDGGMSRSDMDELVDRLAARVAAEPENPEGYALLGRTYRELGRFSEATAAFKRLIELRPGAEAYSSLGEALAASQNGLVTTEAHAAMVAALSYDRTDARARFYLGLEQAGKGNPQAAIAIWRDLTAGAPADAPWVDMVRQQMAAVAQDAGIAPMAVEPRHPFDLLPRDQVPETPAVAAAAPASPVDGANPAQTKMIEGMVAGLAARLAQDPSDYDGWMMLGRSYTVLKDTAKAADAYRKAIGLRPKDTAPRLQYAGLLMMSVDPDDASPLPDDLTATVSEILKLQPEQPEALYLAGLGRAKARDAAGARGYWQKAQKATAEGSSLRAEIDRRLQLLK